MKEPHLGPELTFTPLFGLTVHPTIKHNTQRRQKQIPCTKNGNFRLEF